ncbi:MAG TPA: outer membrane protein assembly factor BamD [Candidatus Paceibacterota bacterium]|nr:outer membrane protein assembly factor BamD [Candidatus Paceibacterota bacterium]HRT57285.1 outer membrane protein assembly factor BamD [Candidatus Paceibacterota bacterium]
MRFRFLVCLGVVALLVALPFSSPAPLIYRPGEGWTYEPVGSEGKWRRTTAKEQLDVAQAAFDQKDYGLALRAARRAVKEWPISDYAPQAQYLVARCYEAKGRAEKAFKEYQKLLEKHPKTANFSEVVQRQVAIADQFLAGKRFRLWGVIPTFPSMEKTAEMYEQIVKTGPYSEVAPQAQLKVGAAREKQRKYPLAAKAYELAADRYHDRPQVAAEALYRQGLAYQKQAKTAEYDQNAAAQAIASFTDFMTLYPQDSRVPEAEKIVAALKTEQARGSFQTAQFYEKYKKWNSALIYYGDVVWKDPNSEYAARARTRIEELKQMLEAQKK